MWTDVGSLSEILPILYVSGRRNSVRLIVICLVNNVLIMLKNDIYSIIIIFTYFLTIGSVSFSFSASFIVAKLQKNKTSK